MRCHSPNRFRKFLMLATMPAIHSCAGRGWFISSMLNLKFVTKHFGHVIKDARKGLRDAGVTRYDTSLTKHPV
jgi:hypothetical protein